MDTHIKVIGALYIVMGVIGIMVGLLIFGVLAGGGIASGDETAMWVTSGVGMVVGGFIAVMSVPGIIGGVFLLQRKEWARILILVLSFLNLLSIPFGTALGIYAIWALMKEETASMFRIPAATAG